MDTLLGESDDPATMPGYGPIPADLLRDWIRDGLDADVGVSLRRLFAKPKTGALVAMESTKRTFDGNLADFIELRDQQCRTPWCDAPVRHRDHIVKAAHGGPTSAANAQGLCEACNYAKEAIGWQAWPRPGPVHTVETITPTGHCYRSTAPPIGASSQGSGRSRLSPMERRLAELLEGGRVNAYPWPVPPELHTPDLSIVPLTMALLALDTAAYVGSPRAIEAHSAGLWRTDGFNEGDNRPLLSEHQREHASGESFAESLLSPDAGRELGCAYLRPLSAYVARTGTQLAEARGDSAILTFWAIDDFSRRPSGAVLLAHLRDWVADWGAAPAVLRFLDTETETGSAVRSLGLLELEATDQPLPYRWFALS